MAATISNEIAKLRKIAGIKEEICAHMFRHRFITNFFVKLIKQYDWENKNEFKNALLDINSCQVFCCDCFIFIQLLIYCLSLLNDSMN